MGHRLRHTYGHGAAKITLAPAFTPSPYARALTARGDLAGGLEELRKAGAGRIAARLALAGGGGLVAALALAFVLSPFFARPPDSGETQIVMAMPKLEEEELLPEPEPEPVVPEPEPEPEVIAQEEPVPLPEPEQVMPEPEPEPVKVVKKQPPPPPPMPAMPAPAEPPREFVPTPAPVRVAREPVKQPPKVVSIDPLSPVPAVPSEEPAPLPQTTRVAKNAPAANRPALPALADFAPIGDPAPTGAPAAVASRAVRTNVVARNNTPSNRPVAFAAAASAAPPAAFDESAVAPALATRNAVKRPTSAPTASSRPQSLGFNAGTPSASAADVTPQAVGRTERALPQRSTGGAQGENLAAVPLGSLAACATDREEDERKMAVLGAVRGRTECSSAAGRYRFVETKNLNAFLMWIERAPNRPAVDRCV
ncbi:MAG: hypothetical protein FJ091_17605 [Deltaproteobacteria bacterium]|nr:hypothetical protein [Deltaproteobacteria bacterium]